MLLLKDKLALIWMLIVPCVYILVFGSAFNMDSDRSGYKASLDIYNQDTGFLSQHLLQSLESENLKITMLQSEPAEPPSRYLVIPPNFTDSLLNKAKVKLAFKNKQDANIEAKAAAEIAVQKSYLRLLANMSELAKDDKAITSENISLLENRKPLVNLESSLAGKHVTIPTGFNQQVPANIVMITMLIGFIYASGTLVEERRNGILKKVKIAPISFNQLYLGKLLGVTSIAMLQIILLLAIGRIVFGVYFGNDIPALILLLIGFAVTVGSFGLCLGFMVKDEEKVTSISVILAISLSAISGCWWPIEITPSWMQHLAMFLPPGITLKALHELVSFGNGIKEIWPFILGITAYGTIFSILAARFLSRVFND